MLGGGSTGRVRKPLAKGHPLVPAGGSAAARRVLGPIGRADDPITAAVGSAGRKVAAAQKRLPVASKPLPGQQGKADLVAALHALSRGGASRRAVAPVHRGVVGSVTHEVSRELAGTGPVAKTVTHALKQAAGFVGKNAVIVPTGGGTVATRGVGAVTGSRGAPMLAATQAPVKLSQVPVLRRAVEDLINFPAQAIPSLYVPAAAAVEAVQGRPARLTQLRKDIAKSDPLYALGTGQFGKALHLAGQHPGFTALEIAGAKGAVGRGVGAALRHAPLEAAQRAGSTARVPRVTPGTGLVEKRVYSPDVVTKATQVVVDRGQSKRAAALRKQADRVEAVAPRRAVELRGQADRVDPTIMRPRERRRRVDERMAVNEGVRRQNRGKAVSEAQHAITGVEVVRGTPAERARIVSANRRTRVEPSAATVVAVQNIAKATPAGLRKYRDEIAAEHSGLSRAGQHANRELRNQLDKAIAGDLSGVQGAAERYAREVIGPRTQALVDRGMLPAGAAERAPLIPYAARNMGAVHDGARLVSKDGSELSNSAIREHMVEHGHEEPGYVTQAPGQRGARNFFMRSTEPPRAGSMARTGAATRQGTFDAHPDVLVEGAARAQGLVDAFDGFQRTVGEFAHRGDSGRIRVLPTKARADRAASEISAVTGTQFRAVRVNPFGGRAEQLQQMLDRADAQGDLPGAVHPVAEAIQSAVRGEDGSGPWALIPADVAARVDEHMKLIGNTTGGKALQLVSSAFRRTVLATSPSWLTGNVAEAAVRSLIGRVGIQSWRTGRKVMRELERTDPVAAQELAARALAGGHFALADKAHVRRGAEQFDGTGAQAAARALGAFWRAPGPKQLAGAWHHYTDWVFRAVNGRIESQFQTAMLGKAIHRSDLMSGMLLKTADHAVAEAARGLTNTAAQVHFARELNAMYGKYDAFSPTMRKWINGPTPFIAWTRNALNFVYHVLPRDHPALTAAIASAEQVEAQWRKDRGLDLFGAGMLPPFLQGSIPLSGGRHERVSRYTPFGLGDPAETLGGLLLPQASGVVAAFKGQDWKGKKLVKADGSPADAIDKFWAAAQAFGESTIPVLAKAVQVAQKGPGSLNPLAPIQPTKKYTPPPTPRGGRPTSSSAGSFDYGAAAGAGASTAGPSTSFDYSAAAAAPAGGAAPSSSFDYSQVP